MANKDHRIKLPVMAADKLREFMLSDDLRNCRNISVDKADTYTRIAKEYSYRNSSTYKMMWECQKAVGITLEKLFEKFGIELILDDDANRMREKLTELSEAGFSFEKFNILVSRIASDFYYYDEVKNGSPTQRFFCIKNRFLARKQAAEAEAVMRERCPEFRRKAKDRHYNCPLDIEELAAAAELWHLSIRWLLAMDDDASAYIPDPAADKALMYYMMCHAVGKKQFTALLDKMFSEGGICA